MTKLNLIRETVRLGINENEDIRDKLRGVVENQENLVEDLTAAFVNHYKDDPMGMFMHAKSSYLDAISRAKNFSFKAAGLYRAHSSMSKQEFQDAVMKHFVPHLMKHGFPKHASAGWGEAEHDLMKSLTQDVKEGLVEGRVPKLPRRHFFDTYGGPGNGIAYTDNTHWWKIVNGQVVDFTDSYEGTGEWQREFVARQRQQDVKEGLVEGYKEPTDAVGHAKMAAKIKKMLDDTLADRGDRHGNPDAERLSRAYEYHMKKAKEKQGVAEGSWGTMKITPSTAKPLSMERPKGEWDPIHGKAPKKNTLKYDIWREKVRQDKELNYRGSHNKQVKEQSVEEAAGDVVTIHQHRRGADMGKYGTFNVERETPTIIVVYDHHTGEMLKFNRSTGRGIGAASHLMIVRGVAEGLNETKTKTGPDISDYHVTASWKDRGTSHKRWDKDHMQGSPADRHQSSIELWQHQDKKPEYHAHHRIERGFWTDQTLEGPPTIVTHRSVHPSLDSAVDALEKHTNEFYKDKKAKEKKGVAKGLNEAKTKTKTKPDISDTFKQKPDQPLTKKDDKKAEKPKDEPKGETPKFKVSSKDETLKKTAGIKMNDRAAELLSKMKDVEADPDDPGYPKHETLPSTNVKPENVPAVINKAMTVKGFLNPEWHIVANLPGNMATAIRTVGRKLFKSFTRTPTDKIVMIGNVMNQGPNTKEEINAAAKWLKNTGQEVSSGDIDFSDFMPGYRADIKMYDAAGCRFLLVEDFAGRYIYVWPHRDSVTMSSAPQLTKEDINIINEAELRFRKLAGLPRKQTTL